VASTNPSPEAMVQLAGLAALTSRVRVGTSILLLRPPSWPSRLLISTGRRAAG
jgi:alkanesulfonate monooxygenase SsuD/methylene tetrahydromethanopterin reductase-like flavin-dependent oxidoreductase (luciferase family)